MIRLQKCPLLVEGGNLTADRQHIFVGWNAVSENERDDRIAPQVTKLLEARYGKPVVVLGGPGVSRPNEHLDMWFTPLGEARVLLGDVRWGARLLKARELKAVDINAAHWQAGPAVLDGLDVIARDLADAGYKVHRIPMIPSGGDASPWVTYNNVLMETRGRERIVYMPVYGIPTLDRAGEKVWKGLGFKVMRIRARQISCLGGTVRCVTNVVDRTEKKGQGGMRVAVRPPADSN